MHEYLFVWEPRVRNFPLRYWIDRGQGAPPDAPTLVGSVPETEVEGMLVYLRILFPEPG